MRLTMTSKAVWYCSCNPPSHEWSHQRGPANNMSYWHHSNPRSRWFIVHLSPCQFLNWSHCSWKIKLIKKTDLCKFTIHCRRFRDPPVWVWHCSEWTAEEKLNTAHPQLVGRILSGCYVNISPWKLGILWRRDYKYGQSAAFDCSKSNLNVRPRSKVFAKTAQFSHFRHFRGGARNREIDRKFDAIKNPRQQIGSASNFSLINLCSNSMVRVQVEVGHCSKSESQSAAPTWQVLGGSKSNSASTDCDCTQCGGQEIWKFEYKASRTRVTALQRASLHCTASVLTTCSFSGLFRIQNTKFKNFKREKSCCPALPCGHQSWSIECSTYFIDSEITSRFLKRKLFSQLDKQICSRPNLQIYTARLPWTNLCSQASVRFFSSRLLTIFLFSRSAENLNWILSFGRKFESEIFVSLSMSGHNHDTCSLDSQIPYCS